MTLGDQAALPDQSRDRRGMRWSIAVLVIALIWMVSAVTPSPYGLEKPGPVVDALGEVTLDGDEIPVIDIDGATVYPTSGSLNILAVSTYGTPDSHSSWFEVALALFDPSAKIVLISDIYPEGITADDRAEAAAAMMSNSQHWAIAAALQELDIDTGQHFVVASVLADGPADGLLEVGDVVQAVDGTVIHTLDDLRAALQAASGDNAAVTVELLRDNTLMQIEVQPAVVEASTAPVLGITVTTQFDFPFDVGLTLGDIGGPSAGMIFALAIYDELTPGGLAGDLEISGTGTITPDGQVGAIGGLEQKMWGASRAGTELFLMPVANCEDVPDRIPGNMRIAPVATLKEAIAAIETAVSGGEPAGLERCETAELAASSG